jgi:cell filamentation protein
MASGGRADDYDAATDPYCYPDSTVLKNIPDLRDPLALAAFEAVSPAQRADEALPQGRLSVTHYRAIHRHLFQDVYSWAGRFRTVRLAKQGSAFCYPENIAREMRKLFSDLKRRRYFREFSAQRFALAAAHFLATLNAIHPFREGNGRTQMTFFALLADQADHPLNLDALRPEPFLAAMVSSFHNEEGALVAEIERMIR